MSKFLKLPLLLLLLLVSVFILANNTNANKLNSPNNPPKITCSGSLSSVTLPFIEDWESYNGSVIDNGDVYCATTYRWELETSTNEGRAQWGTNAYQANGGSGAITLDRSVDNGININYLILTIDMSSYSASTNLELEFDYVDHGDENNSNDRIWLRGSNTDAWVEAYDLAPAYQGDNTYHTVNSIDIDNILSGASPAQTVSSSFQIRFGQEDNAPVAGDGISFDNIKIIENSCPKPSDLAISNISVNSADLSWTENGTATSWDVEYGSIGFTKGSGTTVSGVSNPYTLSGLSANTSYDYYVRSHCGSYWVGPYSFETSCNSLSAITLPFSEDWESYNGNIEYD